MAKGIKDRKVFGLKGFRGLDTENKPLKVAPFRAVDGKNFIIDSETLKTRPSFKYLDTPLKSMNDTFIVDYYVYGDLYIYITNKGFVFKYENKILSDSSTPNVYTIVPSSRNFKGYTPIFQEEKETLFVFGLDNIYVISKLHDDSNGKIDHVVLYAINDKLENPFPESNSYFEIFNDLPIPYEPTIFIGDKNFDDVNLLSNVTKYKLFSKSDFNVQEGTNLYHLPTHYDKDKHGEMPRITVEFYKNKYGGLNIFPIFLGIQNENFEGVPTDYGGLIGEEVELNSSYVAKETFEYITNGATPPTLTPIKEIVGLTKNEFFKMSVKETGKNVFEFLLDYINMNYQEDPSFTNKVFKFKMPYEKSVNYKDSNDKLVKVARESDEANVYVQLKKFNINDVKMLNKTTYTSNEQETSNFGDSWPSYPQNDASYDHVVNLTPTPSFSNGFGNYSFNNMANNWLNLNRKNYVSNDGETLLLKARLYDSRQIPGESSYISLSYQQDTPGWFYSPQVDSGNYPDYPYVNTGSNPVLTIPFPYQTSGQHASSDQFFNKIQTWLESNMHGLPSNKNQGYVKFQWYTYWDDGYGTFYEKKQSIVAHFTYNVGSAPITMYRRKSFNMSVLIDVDGTLIMEDLYEISYDDVLNSFTFTCKDYFYDYNNEPPIDIRVEFRQNPDYNMIARSKFGITFGSENRLFLAGHEDSPNVDRFNVSNDLLGDNIKNQSYELSYFPSMNYRVLGGRGAINGYVLATDTQLYVTKEDYPNDSKLFIRNRTMDDNGVVGYNEFKTNIDKSPINKDAIVRFYNDILVLSEDGLHGIELASNVLTNERLVKLRSGFINEDLTLSVKNSKEKIFVYEDNFYMYIFVDKKVYVADSRYIAQNPNSVIENYSYEIVKWETNTIFKSMKEINGKKVLLDKEGINLYVIEEGNSDDEALFLKNEMFFTRQDVGDATSFQLTNDYIHLLDDIDNLSFTFDNLSDNTMKIAEEGIDYNVELVSGNKAKISVDNFDAFRSLVKGDKIHIKTGQNTTQLLTIQEYSEERDYFIISRTSNNVYDQLNILINNVKLYPLVVFEDWSNPSIKKMLLSMYKSDKVDSVKTIDYSTQQEYTNKLLSYSIDYLEYEFDYGGILGNSLSPIVKIERKIRLEWVSPILDFGYNFGEKTMFRTNLYGTKQDLENEIKIGYRTMRRFNRFDRSVESDMMKGVEASNPFNFDEVNFNLFAISSFSHFGASIPMKENNFLYIQFLIIGDGNIELNSIEILYKINRMLKTIS